jgi:hypothetical protein
MERFLKVAVLWGKTRSEIVGAQCIRKCVGAPLPDLQARGVPGGHGITMYERRDPQGGPNGKGGREFFPAIRGLQHRRDRGEESRQLDRRNQRVDLVRRSSSSHLVRYFSQDDKLEWPAAPSQLRNDFRRHPQTPRSAAVSAKKESRHIQRRLSRKQECIRRDRKRDLVGLRCVLHPEHRSQDRHAKSRPRDRCGIVRERDAAMVRGRRGGSGRKQTLQLSSWIRFRAYGPAATCQPAGQRSRVMQNLRPRGALQHEVKVLHLTNPNAR